MAYLDLDEVPYLLGGRLVDPRPGLVRFRRRDYLGDPGTPLAEAVRAEVAAHTGTAPDGPIRLLTNLRTLGRCFNPVSLYYCYDRDEDLKAVVAEVTNTPWGERHAYVLDGRRSDHAKAMRVSPFMGMDQRYAVSVAEPGETLSVHIETREDGDKTFDAASPSPTPTASGTRRTSPR